jgi:hypothetical protein
MAPASLLGRRCRAQRKPLRFYDTMMLTELYYYSGNYPAAKAASRGAFRFSPTGRCDEADTALDAAVQPLPGLAPTDVFCRRTVQEVSANCTTAAISDSDLRCNRETAPEWSLDRQSRNKLTGKRLKKRDGPRLRNAKPPLTRPRGRTHGQAARPYRFLHRSSLPRLPHSVCNLIRRSMRRGVGIRPGDSTGSNAG